MSGSGIKTQMRGVATAVRRDHIDLVLAVMCAVTPPGVTWSRNAIAELTGMSHGWPYVIEQKAMMKLRRKLQYTSARQLGSEL